MSNLAAPAFLTGGALVSGEGREAVCGALAALVERAREGDGRAFDRLMIETQERVLGGAPAWRLIGSREDARDAAQEVYLRVFRHLGRFRGQASGARRSGRGIASARERVPGRDGLGEPGLQDHQRARLSSACATSPRTLRRSRRR